MPSERERLSGHYDIHLKSANYLLAAHAAGLIGCLATLKDYATTPQLKGIGVYIVIFGIGLLAAAANYIGLVFARMLALNIADNAAYVLPDSIGLVTKVHLWGLGIALTLFVVAVIGIIFKFASL